MILVLGKNGQLARAFKRFLPSDTIFWGHEELPVIDREEVTSKLLLLKPGLIVNTAAYTAVDKAESEPDQAVALNALLPEILANYAHVANIPLIHFSTDYVFGGEGNNPLKEDDPKAPVSVYGSTKLEGETRILSSGANAYIFRTSWVFSFEGHNFVKTILRLARDREVLKIVNDQVGNPTYAEELARVISEKRIFLVESAPQLKGVYHLSGEGFATWHELSAYVIQEARKMGFELKVKEVQGIPTSEYPTPARRPKNSRLAQEKVRKLLGLQLSSWQDSVRECLEHLKGKSI